MKKRGTYKNFASFSLIYFWVEISQKKMSKQNQKNVQKNRKILKNLLMYDKKNSFSHTEQQQQEQPPKKHPPPTKKVRKEKKSWNSRKKTKKEQPRKEKQTVKDKITGLWNFFLSLQNILFHTLAYKNQCATLKKKNQKPKRIDK